MKLARYIFGSAVIYGVLVTFPLYFYEQTFSVDFPPAISHAEYYYSFISITLAWQILFIFIIINPERYRPIMIPCIIEKLSLLPTFFILNSSHRFPVLWIPLLIVDLVFAVLFFIAFAKIKKAELDITEDTSSTQSE